MFQEVVIPAIRLFRRSEPGKLPDGPELAAVHVAVNAASVWKIARIGQITRILEVAQLLGPVKRLDWNSAYGSNRGRHGRDRGHTLLGYRDLCAKKSRHAQGERAGYRVRP
jgi:hypothetical protein